MHGNPCLAKGRQSPGELLVRPLPAGLVSQPSALLRPSQLCEYRSDLYLGKKDMSCTGQAVDYFEHAVWY